MINFYIIKSLNLVESNTKMYVKMDLISFLAYLKIINCFVNFCIKANISMQLMIHICYILSMISILSMYYWHANEITLYVCCK